MFATRGDRTQRRTGEGEHAGKSSSRAGSLSRRGGEGGWSGLRRARAPIGGVAKARWGKATQVGASGRMRHVPSTGLHVVRPLGKTRASSDGGGESCQRQVLSEKGARRPQRVRCESCSVP